MPPSDKLSPENAAEHLDLGINDDVAWTYTIKNRDGEQQKLQVYTSRRKEVAERHIKRVIAAHNMNMPYDKQEYVGIELVAVPSESNDLTNTGPAPAPVPPADDDDDNT